MHFQINLVLKNSSAKWLLIYSPSSNVMRFPISPSTRQLPLDTICPAHAVCRSEEILLLDEYPGTQTRTCMFIHIHARSYMYMHGHSSIVHKGQKVATAQVSVNRGMDKQTMGCTNSGMK